ncbi:hypothetical protein [Herbaspirillum sp. alder98]|uniref:hypothetical protein n=1 Tax=Herbaspirillum sp. alder98 TaxID=2913096 RepID=UPI001CD8B961|nr:hypothetical protein [Herbaspirillum sp. alder98]MCA1326677.1 hypothetical protein [Herbaspirillum sp. alder98]
MGYSLIDSNELNNLHEVGEQSALIYQKVKSFIADLNATFEDTYLGIGALIISDSDKDSLDTFSVIVAANSVARFTYSDALCGGDLVAKLILWKRIRNAESEFTWKEVFAFYLSQDAQPFVWSDEKRASLYGYNGHDRSRRLLPLGETLIMSVLKD